MSEATDFVATLEARLGAVYKKAAADSGGSEIVYESRCQDAMRAMLDAADAKDRLATEIVLRQQGYEPEREPFVPEPGECAVTGITEDHCPCGRHL